MTGHLFVVHGDLIGLACDAVVLPCDMQGNVSRVWQPLLPALPDGSEPGWIRATLGSGQRWVAMPAAGKRAVVLVATVDVVPQIAFLIDGVEQAVRATAAMALEQQGRVKPLLALPFFGTGEGGLRGRRGEVGRALVEALSRVVTELDIDVALVLYNSRDLAAVQSVRADHQFQELSPQLAERADELGQMAARGELSLFMGAGVSVPLGLPSWDELLNRLADQVPTERPAESDPRAAAELLVHQLGDRYAKLMAEWFAVQECALGHLLLAGLKAPQMVTTNYDDAMETAFAGSQQPVHVLTSHLAIGSTPYLLKLHGPFGDQRGPILTTSDYAWLSTEMPALHGVVESLLLTSHLLFVGFGLDDYDFVPLVEGVQRVRRLAQNGDGRPAGTVLALHRGSLKRTPESDELRTVSMEETSGSDRRAARQLEVFLDRLAWRAAKERNLSAEFFLDPQYESGFPEPGDTALRNALLDLACDERAKGSVAWPRVQQLLNALGWQVPS